MLHSALFTGIRVLEILVSIPIIGMLGWFVHPYVHAHANVPDNLLTLFIVSILACAWALVTLHQFNKFRAVSGPAIAILDLGFVGAFIAAIVLLRGISKSNCGHLSVPLGVTLGDKSYSGGNSFGYRLSKSCAMLKAAWILAIIDCVLFFITCVLSFSLYRSYKAGTTHHTTKESYGRRSGSTSTYSSHRNRHHRRAVV